MRRPRPFFEIFLWSAVLAILLALIAAGILTNITLRSIEKNLPSTLLQQLHDLELIVDNLAQLVYGAELAKAAPTPENLRRLRQKAAAVQDAVTAMRNTYVFDNLIQASAFHAVVAPAIADAQLWLSEGVSGYGPETDATVGVVLSRMSGAFQKAANLNHTSEITAQKILFEQRNRLDQFLSSVNLLFALALATTSIMVLMLIRQSILERREVLAHTERQQAEEALKEREATLRSIFRVAPIGIGLVCDRVLTQVNDRLCEMLGYSREELIGESARILYPSQEEFELVGKVKYAQINERGTGTLETLWKKKDGTVIDVLLSSIPLDSTDLTLGVTFTALDISERKQAEAALKESEERFKELAELLPETIYEMDSSGNLTFVNQNAFDHFAVSQEDFVRGLNAFDMISAEDRPRALANAKRVMNGERIGLNEYKALRKDGSTFPAILHSSVKLVDGKPVGVRGIVIDITETKRLEARLRQAHKIEALGTLAGGIAHDFNNILAAIIGYTEMALTDVSPASPKRQYLGQVLNASHRAKDLVKQILASSRQTLAQERIPVEITPVLEEALKLLRASLPSTIEIRQRIGSITGLILADPTEVHQVLVNLCTNAAHAMEEKGGVLEVSLGEVTVDTDVVADSADLKPGEYLRLTVSDTGHGIDPATLERVFDPYFTTKEAGRGSGLGLAVVNGIVKRHEGTVAVSSEPGVGTTFHVYFPRTESTDLWEVGEKEEPLPRGTERVLFVDDEQALVEMGKKVLEWLGYEATVTTSSEEALELFRAHPDRFDVVITDYTMPRMTGADLAKEMMRIRPDIPVILCTGFSEKISEEKARNMGIRAYAMKPLDMRDIARNIRRVLAKE